MNEGSISPRAAIVACLAVVLVAASAIWLIVGNNSTKAKPAATPSSSTSVYVAPDRTSGSSGQGAGSTEESSPSPTQDVVKDLPITVPGTQGFVAANYIEAYYSQKYNDPSPTSWVQRTKKFVTPGYFNTNLAPLDGPLSESDKREWKSFQENQASTGVKDVSMLIEPVSEKSDKGRVVRATFTTYTEQLGGDRKDSPAEDIILVMVNSSSGWLVSNVTRSVD